MKKEIRQAAIERIINKYPIAKQEQLMQKLGEAGINATQATISRDIREMNIIKQQDGETWRYVIYKNANPNELGHLYEIIESSVTSVQLVQFVNVIHTLPSYANTLAAVIDELGLDSVAGTIAGHDTIVIFSVDHNAAVKINTLFQSHLGTEI